MTVTLTRPVPMRSHRDTPPAVNRVRADGQSQPCERPEPAFLFRGSTQMQGVWTLAQEVAGTNATVLLRGESGVGKDVLAHAIHAGSSRRVQPFVKVNCAALPSELLESELFGYEKGAFTGAHRRKFGQFEYAHNGSIYLDEIAELPLALQAKLLHVLQDFRFSRIGGHELNAVDARVIAATNQDLEAAMCRGEFRQDLYYRLNVVEIRIPPLRERLSEIPALSEWLLARLNAQYQRVVTLSPQTLALFQQYSWPGNVRELDNLLRRLVVLGNVDHLHAELRSRIQPVVTLQDRGESDPARSADDPKSLGLKEIARRAARESERRALVAVLERVRWNRTEAAAILKVSYKTILNKIAEFELDPMRARRRAESTV
jgi:two-component system response regulator AtoC